MKKQSKAIGLLIALLVVIVLLAGAYAYYVFTYDALSKNFYMTIGIAAGIGAAFLFVLILLIVKATKNKKAAKEEQEEPEEKEEAQEQAQEEKPEDTQEEQIEEVPEEAHEEQVQEIEEEAAKEPEEETMIAQENKELQEEPMAIQEEEPVEEVQEPAKEAPKAAPIDASISAILAQQVKFNENVDKRLADIDKSLKLIADALRGLVYDAVPAGPITVPVAASEEVPQADGGDYFDQVQQEAPEAPAQEEEIPAQEEEEAPIDDSWIATADQEIRIKPKMSFDMRLRVADDDIKKFYSDIKNELLSYGIHDRISRHRENFNQGRINICRMVINGKTLKVYLAVDPESIDKRYFHHTDVGHRKGLIELPTMINVRSKVAARKVKELITLMMESLVISKKPYEEHDFAKDLTLDGFTTIETKGYDYLIEKSMTLDKAKEYPDNFAAQLIEMVEDNEYQERFIKTSLTIDDLTKNFKDGDVVDIDKVRELGLGPANSNFLSIKEGAKINKKLKVYANEFTPDAVKMICLSGGETFLVVQPELVVEEV